MSDAFQPSLADLEQHATFVRGLARRLLADPWRAEDLAQETMLRALKGKLRERHSMRAWLKRIAVNLLHESAREEKRHARREERGAAHEVVPDTTELVTRLELQRAVASAVLDLPEIYRTTVLLRFSEGLPIDIRAGETTTIDVAAHWQPR